MEDAQTSATAIQILLNLLPLWLGLVFVPLAIAILVVRMRKRPVTLLRALLQKLSLGALPLWIGLGLGVIWLVIFCALIVGILWTIAATATRLPVLWQFDPGDLRWFLLTLTATTAALAAVVALPFTLLRTGFAARQTRTAEDNLTTNLINKAVEGLGAQKEINRLGRTVKYTWKDKPRSVFQWHDEGRPMPDADTDEAGVSKRTIQDWEQYTQTVPNIEVRLGAIYALERIAQDSPRDHIRVMEILCAYLRENAPARDARRHDLGPWPDYPDKPTNDDLKARERTLKERREALDIWIADLQEHHAPRADIQAAITVIGRRSPAQIALEHAPKDDATPTYRLDLRKVNLQAADLSRLNLAAAQLDAAHLEGAVLDGAHLKGAHLGGAHLERAHLGGAHLEGVDLSRARLEGVDLSGAHLQGTVLRAAPHLARAELFRAHLEGARLVGAHLEGADLRGAHLQGADLRVAHLEGANLVEAHLEGANLVEAHLEGVDLSGAHLEGAELMLARLERAYLQRAHLERANFDSAHLEGARLVGAHLEGAELGGARLKGAHLGGAHLEGAHLGGARLKGAHLGGAQLSNTTSFMPATLRGAGLKNVDVAIAGTRDDLPRLLSEAFGDASVTLPEGLKAGEPPLDHWSTDTLDLDEFCTAWRAHQRAIGYAPPD